MCINLTDIASYVNHNKPHYQTKNSREIIDNSEKPFQTLLIRFRSNCLKGNPHFLVNTKNSKSKPFMHFLLFISLTAQLPVCFRSFVSEAVNPYSAR